MADAKQSMTKYNRQEIRDQRIKEGSKITLIDPKVYEKFKGLKKAVEAKSHKGWEEIIVGADGSITTK